MTYDLVIRDAKVVDGSGMPAYAADVAVQAGRIAEIGRVSDVAARPSTRRAELWRPDLSITTPTSTPISCGTPARSRLPSTG